MSEKVRFLEGPHKYFIGDKELISVSALMKSFEAQKDWLEIAKKYAKKNGETAEYWQNQWREKARLGSEAGTILHAMREHESLTTEQEYLGVKCEPVQCDYIDGIKHAINISDLESNKVFLEMMVYDIDYGVCGQIDKFFTTDTHIHIFDYKVDKDIVFKGYSSQWKRAEKFLEPIQHLDNCNGNAYSLKMSMYMYFICKHNKHLKPGKIVLQHITLQRDENEIPVLIDGKPVVLDEKLIELPYRKMEVIDMLKHYKQTNGIRETI